MPLQPGTRLGPYEILSALGAGGMGEVYRARDTKLNRDVALKVLPDLVATDPERLARFHREAQVLASLNHPHIAGIYGFEDSSGTHALAMELVDGPTGPPTYNSSALDTRIRVSRSQMNRRLVGGMAVAVAALGVALVAQRGGNRQRLAPVRSVRRA